MLQLKTDHGYTLTFTPQSNEFTITLHSSTVTDHTAGLCGKTTTDPLKTIISLKKIGNIMITGIFSIGTMVLLSRMPEMKSWLAAHEGMSGFMEFMIIIAIIKSHT